MLSDSGEFPFFRGKGFFFSGNLWQVTELYCFRDYRKINDLMETGYPLTWTDELFSLQSY
jgi:hypothetical protein